jgi:hypothetical protein
MSGMQCGKIQGLREGAHQAQNPIREVLRLRFQVSRRARKTLIVIFNAVEH